MMSNAPPPPNTPNLEFSDLGKLDCVGLGWSAMKDFNRDIGHLGTLGFAEATRPLDANSLELRGLCAY